MALFNQDEADDFYGVMAVGTAALWALGGVPGGLAATVIAACGVGACANHRGNAPIQTPNTIDDHYEQQLLEKGFGMRSIERYRLYRESGLEPRKAAEEAVFEALQERRRNG